MNTPTPSPAPLSAEELASVRKFLESDPVPRELNESAWVSSARRLLATLTAKDEIIAGLTRERDEAKARLEGHRSAVEKWCSELAEIMSVEPTQSISLNGPKVALSELVKTAIQIRQWCADKSDECGKVRDRAESAESRVKVLEEALRPFTTQHVLYVHDDESIIAWTPVIDARFGVSVGDLRRAAASLDQVDRT